MSISGDDVEGGVSSIELFFRWPTVPEEKHRVIMLHPLLTAPPPHHPLVSELRDRRQPRGLLPPTLCGGGDEHARKLVLKGPLGPVAARPVKKRLHLRRHHAEPRGDAEDEAVGDGGGRQRARAMDAPVCGMNGVYGAPVVSISQE